MSACDPDNILREIAEVENQLAGLRDQQEQAEAKLQSLKRRLVVAGHPPAPRLNRTSDLPSPTLPQGGFGNLIALPLQHHPRQEDNTVFLDDSLAPYPDQWGFLAALVPVRADKVGTIAAEAAARGQVIGVQLADTGEDELDSNPWLRPPSRKPKRLELADPIPPQIGGVLSQRLYIEKRGLPSPLINALNRLAAFQNPEFYKKQNLRLSTALTPRAISCAEEHARHISLPRGCLG